MKEPIWLFLDAVLTMHEDSLRLFGGGSGIRDRGLLESALARSKNVWAYEGPVPLPRLAAAYASGIVWNHPFVDGNKRTGFLAAYTFLDRNGLDLDATELDATMQTFALAAGELSEDQYTAWLAQNVVAQSQP